MYHKLLTRQLAKSGYGNGELNIETLLPLVSAAYEEQDLDRRRVDRAHTLMSDELGSLNDELTSVASASALQNVRFQAALDNMQQGLCLFDRHGSVVVCNRRFREIYEIDPAANPVGLDLGDLLRRSRAIAGAADPDGRSLIADHLAISTEVQSSLEQNWPGSRVISIMRNPVDDGGYLDTIDDITESRAAMVKIALMASHDALTNLPNRVLFREYLGRSLSAIGHNDLCAVAIIDLDRFKIVNDTLGHPVGDTLLIAVSERLRHLVGGSNLAARLGGDEFAVVLSHFDDRGDAGGWAQRVIEELSRPYTLDGHMVVIGASIGIEIVTDPLKDPDDIIRNADLALYKAKAEGRGCYSIFAPEFYKALSDRRDLEMDLRAALSRNEMEVHFQPQIDLRSDRVIGFEALARWRHPVRGYVSPAIFIPLAEDSGLIDEIGEWVLYQACMAAHGWPTDMTVSVNLSAKQFRGKRLAATIVDILDRTGLPAQRLDVEVTEHVMLQDDIVAIDTLHLLKTLGITVSLDDFGTGYSSLSFVRSFPFDRIKIDQSFVKDLGENQGSLAIVRAIIGLCDTLHIVLLVEGVESDEQLRVIMEEGVDQVQGYLFGRPMTKGHVAAFLGYGQSLPASA